MKAGLKGVLLHVAQSGLLFTGVCLLLLFVDGQLGLVFAIGIAMVSAIALAGAQRASRLARQHRRREGDLAIRVQRALVVKKKTKASRRLRRGLKRTNRTSGDSDAEITRLEGFTAWAIHAVLGVTACLILSLGVQSVAANRLQPGDLFTFMAYILMVHNPVVRLGRQVTRLGPMLASAERLAGVFARRSKRRDLATAAVQAPETALQCREPSAEARRAKEAGVGQVRTIGTIGPSDSARASMGISAVGASRKIDGVAQLSDEERAIVLSGPDVVGGPEGAVATADEAVAAGHPGAKGVEDGRRLSRCV